MDLHQIELESPTVERRHIENEKLKDEWTVCCSNTNKHFLKYIVQVLFGVAVMLFAFIQVIRDVDQKEIYFSLISGIIGGFLPSPHMNAPGDNDD